MVSHSEKVPRVGTTKFALPADPHTPIPGKICKMRHKGGNVKTGKLEPYFRVCRPSAETSVSEPWGLGAKNTFLNSYITGGALVLRGCTAATARFLHAAAVHARVEHDVNDPS